MRVVPIAVPGANTVWRVLLDNAARVNPAEPGATPPTDPFALATKKPNSLLYAALRDTHWKVNCWLPAMFPGTV